SIGTWIYRVAVNKCLQYLRSKKAKKRGAITVELTDQLAETLVFDHPGVKLENKELARVLFRAIDTLPEVQKVAFTLHKVEDLSDEEIGEILEKSRSAVESLIHRAKTNLRTQLTTYYENQ
ncbi:MAG: RNA polymerase sigma factor, partial [Marinoscillum sp.]